MLAAEGVEVAVLDSPISAAVARRTRGARRLRLASAAALRWPLCSARAAAWFAAGRTSRRDAAATYVQWLAVQSLVRRAGDEGLHLVEEGAVQTLWTARLRAPSPPPGTVAWTLVPAVARSDAVVLVDVPLETAAARLARRRSRHSRTQRLPPEARLAELRHGHALLEDLLAHCPLPVIRVSNDEDDTPEQTAARVVAHLVGLVPPRSPNPR